MGLISSIIELFIEIKLFFADSKYEKEILKKEKEDGIPRPFQKLLKPSATFYFIMFSVIASIGIIYFAYQRQVVYPKNTAKEISNISNRVNQWYNKYGDFPVTLKEVIGNSPIRQEWLKDSWKTPYRYYTLNDNSAFIITSAGSDKVFNTEDDITSK